MTDDEKVDRLDGIIARDGGCVSSGICDPVFKESLRQDLAEAERLLLIVVRRTVALPEYTFEDVAGIVAWAERELGLEY